MKPVILDDSKALNELTTDFSNGLGRLSECTDARVTEEANGIYEAEFDISVTATHFSDLHVDGIVKLKANEYDENQLFRIYRITKPLNGICHVSLQHISYDMTKVAVRPFSTVGAGATMQAIQNNMVGSYPFIFSTDISNTLSSYSVVTPCSARSCIGGREGSFIDVFGGEIHWNNLQVNVMAHRGSDRGVRIAYGKNLVDYRQEVNNSNVYTSVLGYAVKDETVTTGNIQHAVQSVHPKTLIVDFSSEFDSSEEITVAKIDAKAVAYIQSHDIGTPNVNIDVDFIHLWQTEEYKEIASLERVSLFDTVHVFIPKLNVEATAKVVKTIYDPVEERYIKIELGNVRSNLGGVITEAVSTEIANSADSMYGRISGQIQAQIERATAFLTGAEGGYQVTHYHADGTPYETLWMNTDSEATATNILRINANGLGFSNDGGATYRNAWLIDGTLSADFIGTGTITAISIVGSTLTFGDSPNTVTLRTNDEKTGALFDGEGVMQFETNGEFLAKNLDSNDYTANQIRMRSDVVGSSDTYNRFSFFNKKNNIMANQLYADAADNRNEFWFFNNRPGAAINANNHYMGVSSDLYENRLYNFRYGAVSSSGGAVTANNLVLQSYKTSEDENNYAGLRNYSENGTLVNYVSMRSGWKGTVSNELYLVNQNNTGYSANRIWFGHESAQNSLYLYNYHRDVMGPSYALLSNDMRIYSNSSENRVQLKNYFLKAYDGTDTDAYDANQFYMSFNRSTSQNTIRFENRLISSATASSTRTSVISNLIEMLSVPNGGNHTVINNYNKYGASANTINMDASNYPYVRFINYQKDNAFAGPHYIASSIYLKQTDVINAFDFYNNKKTTTTNLEEFSGNHISMYTWSGNSSAVINLDNKHWNGNTANSLSLGSANNSSYFYLRNYDSDGNVRSSLDMNTNGTMQLKTMVNGSSKCMIQASSYGNLDLVTTGALHFNVGSITVQDGSTYRTGGGSGGSPGTGTDNVSVRNWNGTQNATLHFKNGLYLGYTLTNA